MDNRHPLLEELEELFGDEPFGPIEEELFQWFMFANTGKGSGIKELDSLNFEVFKAKLNILLDTVYKWHKEHK